MVCVLKSGHRNDDLACMFSLRNALYFNFFDSGKCIEIVHTLLRNIIIV